jgi:uncharacterized membrane protein
VIALALFAAGSLVGAVIAWAIVSGRAAEQVLTLQVENALLQDRIAHTAKPAEALGGAA